MRVSQLCVRGTGWRRRRRRKRGKSMKRSGPLFDAQAGCFLRRRTITLVPGLAKNKTYTCTGSHARRVWDDSSWIIC